MKVIKDSYPLHPILAESVRKIQSKVIDKYNAPLRLFETGREHARHQALLHKGTTQNIMSRHLFDLSMVPPLYASAIDYAYFDERWSWNLRNSTVLSWYILFGNLVLDICPELVWGGCNRKSTNYTHFELRDKVVLDNFKEFPCVLGQ